MLVRIFVNALRWTRYSGVTLLGTRRAAHERPGCGGAGCRRGPARGAHSAGWSVCRRTARIVGARPRRENPIAVVEFEAASAAASFEFVW